MPSFIYFKDEMDIEEHERKTVSGHCSSASCGALLWKQLDEGVKA